ncbi:MAG: hypothetical protein IJX72_07700 [Clostridia bacterium]|nr:hypothetical protein [Clostridia bacterium]
MKKSTRIILAVVIGTVLTVLAYYLMLPPINVFSTGFWTVLLLVTFFYGLPLGVVSGLSGVSKGTTKLKLNKVFVIIAAIPVAVMVLGGIVSSTFFNALKYAAVIQVEESDFSEDMPEADVVSNISLMDTASASILGNRELGALSDVVSQYDLSLDYNQINYQGTPKKVANLEYVDFFRWINNSSNGVPGYVMVDPVNNDADYIKFDKAMIYVDSAYFGEDLMRKLRFSYPTKIFSTVNFEVDEEGNPYFIVSCMKPRVGLFGAMDVSEVIIFNPCDGTSEIYPVDGSPSWIDNVYDGDLACQKYDWYGTLSGGFWNSVIGNRNCKMTTDGYGYIVRGDDVWYYTGVTSVTSDESNIGFIITNARTGEYKYYPVIGAEEYSAMGAAQGEVQEKGYVASFPSLINVEGEATYIMVLKDENGLVKLYALVNVENYSIVATGDSQTTAKQAYIQELANRGVIREEEIPAPEAKSAEVTVTAVRLATVSGETVVYVTAEDGVV